MPTDRQTKAVLTVIAASLLTLSDWLPVVHATIPYYPYECPIGSGGRDFDGNGNDGPAGAGVPSWDPRSNGVWYIGRSFAGGGGGTRAFGTYGDIPFRRTWTAISTVTTWFFVRRPAHGTAIIRILDITWGQVGDIPVPRSHLPTQTSTLTVYRPSNGATYNSALAEGGEVFMPMEDTFFASRFGQLRDRFGLNWMILHERPMPPRT